LQTIRLPDIGDGLTEAHVLTIGVQVGDSVTRLQAVIEMETDKTTIEVTSPYAGKVRKILVAAGDWVVVGAGLIEVEV
jgi:pyruvate dehydrogenase E2 component (dihydrolipoamide acetyltransferase)